jgi:hypothetical protein
MLYVQYFYQSISIEYNSLSMMYNKSTISDMFRSDDLKQRKYIIENT